MKVNIAAAQYPISSFTSFNEWVNHINSWLEKAIEQGVQIVVFPEYGSMELVSIFDAEIQKDLKGQIVKLNELLGDFKATFIEAAKKYNLIVIAPSFPVRIDDIFVNRTYVFSPSGQQGYQDKWFMTRFEDEIWGISSGEKVLTVFESEFGKFGIQICYDCEFPIGSALLARNGAEMIFMPSCTETIRGASRVHIGARARAMENQCYTIVSQTVGEALWSPAVDINYGFGAIYSTPDKGLPEEGILAMTEPQYEGWLVETIDLQKSRRVRSKGQVLNYKDHLSTNYELTGEKTEIEHCRLY